MISAISILCVTAIVLTLVLIFEIILSMEETGFPLTELPRLVAGLKYVTPLEVVFDYSQLGKPPGCVMEILIKNFKIIQDYDGKTKMIS